MTCFGEKWPGRGGQSDLPAASVFSKFFSLKYSICPGAMFGAVCSEPPVNLPITL